MIGYLNVSTFHPWVEGPSIRRASVIWTFVPAWRDQQSENRREDCDEITGFAANIRPVYSPSRFKKTWRVLVRADRLWQALAVCSLIIRCLWPRPLTLARSLSQSPPAGLPGRPRHPLHVFPCEPTSKTLRGHGHIPSLPWSSLTTIVHYDITLSSQRNGNRLPQQPPLYPFIPTVQGALIVPQNHSDL